MEELVLFLLTITGVLSLLYSSKVKDYLTPINCFLLPIIVNYFLYYWLYLDERTLSETTYSAYMLGVFGFAFGFFVTEILLSSIFPKPRAIVKFRVSSRLEKIFILIGFLACIGGGYIFWVRGLEGVGGRFFFSVRALAVEGKYSNPFVGYGSVFLYVIAMWFFYRLKVQNESLIRPKVWLLLFCLFGTVIFTLAKTDFLINFLSCIYIAYFAGKIKGYTCAIEKRQRLVRYIVVFVALFLFFSLISWARGVRSWNVGMGSKDFFLYKYGGYSLVAFENYVVNFPYKSLGYNSLGGFGKLLSKFGLYGLERPGPELPLGEFNVFSFLFDPYVDFGIIGCGVIMLLLGSFSSLIFRLSRKYAGFFTIFYASYLYALVMAFFDYQFANTQFIWIALLLVLLWVFSKKHYVVKADL